MISGDIVGNAALDGFCAEADEIFAADEGDHVCAFAFSVGEIWNWKLWRHAVKTETLDFLI